MDLPIKTMDFGRVSSNRKLRGSGLSAGDLVMVYAIGVAPAKKNDPYLQRVYVTVLKVDDDGTLPGVIGQERAGITLDPRNLTKVEENEQKELYANFTHQVNQHAEEKKRLAEEASKTNEASD